ncbi:MAG: amidase [Proteobacteria bacterium]|nr:amidase [Pseudomonadota bacterium]NIS69685.1 amidase [Pseudomonadota bacterium]
MRIGSEAEKNPDRLTELSDSFRNNRFSARDYLKKLEGLFVDRDPVVKAFVPEVTDRFELIRRDLAQLESKYEDPFSRPLLFGIPVGVKDIFHVEGFPTRAGSRLPPDVLSGPEARCVSILKSAGAIVLGKTVTTEFAYFAPGPTRNPHNLEHTPGGSSSGSAAAVASGLCPLSLGTQTIGSVLRPASYCGVVGFKPSHGRIPLDGVIPLAPSLDQVGFFTADVEGAMLVASIICQDWKEKREPSSLVFAIPEGPYLEKASEEGMRHFRDVCERLSESGFDIRAIEMLRDFEEIAERHNALVAAEAAMVHRDWFGTYSESYHEKTAELIRRGQAIDSDFLEVCRGDREKLRGVFMNEMEQNDFSVLLAPAAVGSAPQGLASTGDPVMNLPWTYAGLPAVSIPSGVSRKGLPMGLQLVGPWMGDEALLAQARRVAEALA